MPRSKRPRVLLTSNSAAGRSTSPLACRCRWGRSSVMQSTTTRRPPPSSAAARSTTSSRSTPVRGLGGHRGRDGGRVPIVTVFVDTSVIMHAAGAEHRRERTADPAPTPYESRTEILHRLGRGRHDVGERMERGVLSCSTIASQPMPDNPRPCGALHRRSNPELSATTVDSVSEMRRLDPDELADRRSPLSSGRDGDLDCSVRSP